MRSQFAFFAGIAISLTVQPALGSDESEFCSQLQQAHLTGNWASQSFFYRQTNGEPIQLNFYDEISKPRVDTLYYYVRSELSDYNRRSVLNLKFVYKSPPEVSRKDVVDLRNNLWDKLSERQKRRIKNDCAHVNVEGYDRFHLSNSRDYCLQFHFHQRAPNFETLATTQRQESFAFGDMIGAPPPGLGALLISLIGPRAAVAAAAENQFSTARYSQVRSWIQNFQYGDQPDRCIAVHPNFPQDAEIVHIRVNYLGTTASDPVITRDWHLKLSK